MKQTSFSILLPGSLALLLLAIAVKTVAGQTPVLEFKQVAAPNDRLYTRTERDLHVTTAVPSAKEAEALFGVKLYKHNIQPVWIEIKNTGDDRLLLMPMGLDPAYYSAMETAYRSFGQQALDMLLNRQAADMAFREHRITIIIEPHSTRSGYVFSRVDEGTKSFNIDVLGSDQPYTMSFFVPVPGLRIDHYEVDVQSIYDEDEMQDVDLTGLVAGLEALPCCVSDKKGKGYGDPLNIALVGDTWDIWYALMRAGWDETETVYGASLIKMGLSSLTGSEYRYSPVSALYVFDRPQDVALQRARASIDERNHLRLWVTPMRHQGKPVWIGQISRDIGVHFTAKTITTHKIDPNVDETREYLVEDMAYSQSLAKIGYISGVGPASYDEPRGNLTGDPYFTDGLRVVMWLSRNQTSISEIEVLQLGQTPGIPAE